MACTPMISVKNADANTISNVRVIMLVEGCPLSRLPERRASHLYAHLTGKSKKSTYPTLARST